MHNFLLWCQENLLPLSSGLTVTAIVILTKVGGLWQSWELNILDWSFAHNPPEAPDHRIVIIGINEEDIRNVGYPVPDGVLAQLISDLKQHQPRAIGVDIFRDLPVPPGTAELQTIWQHTPQVVGIEKSVLPAPSNPLVQPPPLPPEKVGFADVLLDQDGKIRRALLSAFGTNGEYKFAFATRLASLYLQAAGITLTNGIRDKNAFRFGDVELPRFTGNNGGYVRTDSGGNQILINWRRGAKFPILSLQEFQTKKNDRAYWQDKVVIIGYTAPFSAKDTFFAYNTEIYGVEYHAHVVSQILSTVLDKRSPLCSIPLWLEYCLILVGGLGGMVWALRCNSPWSMYGGLAGSIMLLFSANYGLLVRHYWLPIAPTIFSTISSTIITRNVRDFRAFLQQQAELLEQRQRTLDDAFNAMHNGPLHTLGEMLSLLKMEEVPQAVIITKLQQLDRELRTVYESLRPENLARAASIPLHELLFEVYHRTMQRDFACFRSLKVKIPDIQPIDDRGLSGELKREICDFLEEALCNVGKHAVGATRLTVVCKEIEGKRTIRVIDNGVGLPQDNPRVSGGTKHAQQLAKRLRGKFQRRPNQPQGTICELQW